MHHPFQEDTSEMTVAQMYDKVAELTKKYFSTNNPQLKEQISTFIEYYKQEALVKEAKEKLEYFVQLIFRKNKFRVGQLPILNRALKNKSIIGLLPTGGGKSLTYQLAAMLQPGITIVVDPIRSLMQDQYDGLLLIIYLEVLS